MATKEQELQQSWVWSMQSNDNSIDIVTDWTMTDEWMSYLLRMAGKDAGIAATGSYKIVWRNTDAHTGDTKYEDEELTIKLSAN